MAVVTQNHHKNRLDPWLNHSHLFLVPVKCKDWCVIFGGVCGICVCSYYWPSDDEV